MSRMVKFRYGKKEISLQLPDTCIVYNSSFSYSDQTASELLTESMDHVIGGSSLQKALENRRTGPVTIVVSDITRPIPYYSFLPELIKMIEETGVLRSEIIILIATGMHRPSTKQEHLEMFGKKIVENYTIIDHDATDASMLHKIHGSSRAGAEIKLNRYYVNAGFRIITGLVEPHFMAGFSGSRKSICPGLASLDAIKQFHGYQFLNNTNASNTVLKNNPCHEEASSIADIVPPDFEINIVLDHRKIVNRIFSGSYKESHFQAVQYAKEVCCKKVDEPADIVITSCGGYPLDATFYQCVKGFVSCLPAVKQDGMIIAFGSCLEGIGSDEYTNTMLSFSGKHKDFLHAIRRPEAFVKDQWQFQMHCRTLDKLGEKNLHFFTEGIKQEVLQRLSVHPHSCTQIEKDIQEFIDHLDKKLKIAVFPEGPYCAPLPALH